MSARTIHPATATTICHQLNTTSDDPRWRNYQCGCARLLLGNVWWLCQYHDGYDDGYTQAEATR